MFKQIVVGTDGSETAAKAVAEAIELAVCMEGELHVVCAYEPTAGARGRPAAAQVPGDVEWAINPLAEAEATLAQASEEARNAGVKSTSVYARAGDAADSIIDVAEERDADLVVVGNKGMTGAKRFLLGSVPNKVSHHAPCSVLIIRTL